MATDSCSPYSPAMRPFFIATLAAVWTVLAACPGVLSKPPNVLFFFTDDQDLLLGSLDYCTKF